jgi:hypothetical protein
VPQIHRKSDTSLSGLCDPTCTPHRPRRHSESPGRVQCSRRDGSKECGPCQRHCFQIACRQHLSPSFLQRRCESQISSAASDCSFLRQQRKHNASSELISDSCDYGVELPTLSRALPANSQWVPNLRPLSDPRFGARKRPPELSVAT